MPNTSEGFDQVEASASPEHAVNVVKFESVQSDPAPRRRRGGRRVGRGGGAAGAALEVKVGGHASAPLFEEPKLPVAQPAHDTGDSADSEGMTRPTRRRRRPVQSDDDVREIADERPTRSRRRRSVQVEDEQDEDRPSRRRSRFADDADEADINATLPGFYRTPGRELSLMIDEYRGAWLFAASNVPSLYCRKSAP